MAAKYNHHHHLILIAVLLLVSNYYTTMALGEEYNNHHGPGRSDSLNSTEKEQVVLFLSNYTRTQGLEERLDEKTRRSLALAVLDPDPSSFFHLISICYEDTYIIHPESKELVRVYFYVFPDMQGLFRCASCYPAAITEANWRTRCRRCYPAPITEANWRRYEAAVKRPTRLWITSLDVSNCRLWLEANPPL